MNRLFQRICCIFLSFLLLLPLAGCAPHEEDTGAGRPFSTVLPGDPACLDPQFTENDNAILVLRNITEGLLRLDTNGNPVPAGASSYTVSDDGLSYMFTLSQDSFWFSKNMDPERPERVTSRDYVFAFQRLVDPAMRSPYAEDYRCIKNAGAVISGKMRPSALGVSAPDGNTVLFELEYPYPEFPLLLARVCAAPCNQDFFETTMGRYGLDENTILCNGAFYLTKWNYDQYSSGNFITLRKNAHYHDPDAVFPNSIQITIEHSRNSAEDTFAGGGADFLLTDIYHREYLHDKHYTVQTSACTTMGLIFNPENDLLCDDDIREAIACGTDRTVMEPMLTEDVQIAYGLVPPAVTLLGSSYRTVQSDRPLASAYDPDRAAQLFADASEGLGLETMNSVRVMVPSTLKDTDALLAMCQNWQELFGCYIGIETVSPDEYRSRLAKGEYAIALYSFTPAWNSCSAAIQAYADQSELLGFENRYFRSLAEGLSRPINLADTAALCAKTEKVLLDSHCFIPLFYKKRYLIATAGNRDIAFDSFNMSADLIGAKYLPE